MQPDILFDMNVSKGIAQGFAPFETGNVKYNAIHAFTTRNGFKVRYSLIDAFYIYFLEEGTKYTQRHVGFIGQRTVPAIASYLFNKYEEKNKSKTSRFEIFSQLSALNQINTKTEQRELRHLRSLSLNIEAISEAFNWQSEQKEFMNDWKARDFV